MKKDTFIHMRVSSEMKKMLQKAAQDHCMTLTDFLTHAQMEYIKGCYHERLYRRLYNRTHNYKFEEE